jgi:hypothetical protein
LVAICYQWQRFDGVTFTNIPGATTAAYPFFPNCLDDGAMFRVRVSAPGGDTNFTTLVNVTTDSEAPFAVSANSLDGTTIGIAFNEPIAEEVAGEPSNFVVNNGDVIVSTSILQTNDPRKIVLILASPVSDTFTIDALEMRDRSCVQNSGNSSVTGGVQKLTPRDIGAPVGPGSSLTFTNNEIDVVAGGTNIWGNADQGHAAIGQRSGDFDIWARLDSLSRVPLDSDNITRAGLVIRETLNPDSRNVHYFAEPPTQTGGRDIYDAGQRPATAQQTVAWSGGNGNTNGLPAGIPNAWIRIKRVGDIFTAYRSSNGVDWIETTRHTMGFSNTVYVGLAATAHVPNPGANPSGTTLAKFRDVHVPCPPTITTHPSPDSQMIPLHGSVSYSVAANNPPDSGTLNYQWYRDGLPIAGAISDTLNLPDLSGTDTGVYSVRVGNDGGQVDSDLASLIVSNAMIVVTNDSLSVTQGTVATISAATLTGNDFDPESQTLSVVGVSGLYPASFSTDFNSGLPAGTLLFPGALGGGIIDSVGGVGDSGVLKLTMADNDDSGAFIVNDLNSGRSVTAYSANFMLRMGNGSAEPADGFSFNFGPNLQNAAGATLGENGVGTNFTFAVDNYRFLPVNLGGPIGTPTPVGQTAQANTSGMKLQYGGIIIAAVPLSGAWNSPRFVPVSITVMATGEATVLVDGTNVFGTVVLPGYTPRPGRFGLYARNGGQNIAQWVDNLSISTVTTLETGNLPATVTLAGSVITYTPPNDACGTDTFYYLVSDNLGDTKVGQVDITLVETNPPVIVTCVPDQTVVGYTNAQVALPDLRSQLTATDACGPVTITQSPLPGTLLNENTTNIVTFTVTDEGGLSSECQASIIIQANRPSFIPGSASYSGGTFTALFQTVNGVNYRIEYTDTMNAGFTWNLLTTIIGDGTVKQISDPGPLPPMRYYRIVPTP